ncbi:MAG: ATP-dependent DNA helicase RecG [Chitinispirillales bacterium]|jgi:ATP-dependent DNA helicase RecG|nr:ATP-dependent DNA helicase RecG [Chitinispirillales bacterium]
MKKVTPSQLDFHSLLQKVPGLGPKRREALEAVGVQTVGELLSYYPTRYIDRSKRVDIGGVHHYVDSVVTVRGVVSVSRTEYFGRARHRVVVGDDTGTIEAIWYIRSMKIKTGETLSLTGKIMSGHGGKFLMIHPTMEKIPEGGENNIRPILAVYSVKEPMREAGVNQKLLRKAMDWALKNVGNFPRVLPLTIEEKHKFPPLAECLKNIHQPEDLSTLDKYKARLKYEELYRLALNLRWNRKKFALPGYPMSPGELDTRLREVLPFELTKSQEKAIKILHSDSAMPHRMHRLLQGDVGSGKTLTALFACLPALNSGRQAAWMAPTEVLAKQTKNVVERYLSRLGIDVAYLGAGESPEKRRTLQGLASGELRFVVGTHALFMPSVKFENLGMVIIDEQHKFGAAQRLKLQEKGASCDFLMMSATPIPQTLAKTLYGDLDIVEITSRPCRADVSTHIVPHNKRADMEKFIFEQVNKGFRAFYVVPRIEEQGDDEPDDGGDNAPSIKTVDAVAEKLKKGPLSAAPIHRLHGQMSIDEREASIAAFKDGPPGVLVSTTIVEVGVDIVDATVMVIENPEFFGLAQLHQIRGRVGRGDAASYCFLIPGIDSGADTDKNNSFERLKFLCGTRDGFEIAEWDLRRRGPGEVAGFRQSGWDDLCAADVLEDAGMFQEILHETEGLFEP